MRNKLKKPDMPFDVNFEPLETMEDMRRWIVRGIKYFKEWYQPVYFGNGFIAHVTLPPDWKPAKDLVDEKMFDL